MSDLESGLLRAIPLYDELQSMTDADVIRRYGEIATLLDTGAGKRSVAPDAPMLQLVYGQFYLNELARREMSRANDRMLTMTATITTLTKVVTVLTIINVLAAVAAVIAAIIALTH